MNGYDGITWALFEETGNVETYLLYKEEQQTVYADIAVENASVPDAEFAGQVRS